MKFYRGGLDLSREKQGVAQLSLPKPWGDVAHTIMWFITLDNSYVWVRIFHFGFLNQMKGHKMNIPTFLFAKLDKVTDDFKKSKGNEVRHQGLILVIFKHVVGQMGISNSFIWVAIEGGKIEVNMDWILEGRLDKKLKMLPKDEYWQLARVARKSSHTYCDKLELMYIEASMSKLEKVMEVQAIMDKAAHLLDPTLAINGKMRSRNSRGSEDPKDTSITELSLTNPKLTPLVNNS